MHPCFLFPLMALVSALNALPYSFVNYHQPEESLRVRDRRNGLQVAASDDSLGDQRFVYGTSKEASHELSGPDRYADLWDVSNPSVIARALYGMDHKELQSRSKPRLSDEAAIPLEERKRLTHQDVFFQEDLMKRNVQPTMNVERSLLDVDGEGSSSVQGDPNTLKKREGPSLSIVNPLDVLRQRMMLDMARRRLKENLDQIQANAEYLKTLGKRSASLQMNSSDLNQGSSQRRRRHRQEYLNSEEDHLSDA